MLWEDILRTLGGMAILVAALAWLSKSLITNLLSKDVERFKSELQASSQLSVESFKTSLQIETHRNAVEYTALHAKRAELISELYSRCVSLYTQILGLSRELGAREVRAEHYAKYEAKHAQPWELEVGIHTLSSDEEAKARALDEDYKEFMRFYRERKIYFSEGAELLARRDTANKVGSKSGPTSEHRSGSLSPVSSNTVLIQKFGICLQNK